MAKKFGNVILNQYPHGFDKTETIPFTAFKSKSVNLKYYSQRRKTDPRVGSPTSTLNIAPAMGIASSQADDCTILFSETKNVLIGVFEKEYFLFNFDNKTIHLTRTNTQNLYKVLLAYFRYRMPKGELDKNFRKLDFEDNFIDVNQEKAFRITVDELKYDMENNIYKFELFADENLADAISSEIDGLDNDTKDITPYVLNEYSQSNLITNNFEIVRPEESKGKAKAKKKTPPKKELWDGVESFTKEEMAKWDMEMMNSYTRNKEVYLSNRDNLEPSFFAKAKAFQTGKISQLALVGEAGVGKTTSIKMMAGCLGFPLIQVGGSANLGEDAMFGHYDVVSENGASVTTWVDGPITKAIKTGAWLLFDEINAADAGVLMKMNSILDDSKCLMLDSGEFVRVNPKFKFTCSMNLGDKYSGTGQMNAAFMDRMPVMKVADMTVDKKAAIIMKATGYKNAEVVKNLIAIQKFANRLANEEGVTGRVSIRRLIDWVQFASIEGEFVKTSLDAFVNHMALDEEANSVDEYLESEGIGASIMEKIREELSDVEIEEEDFD